VSTKKIKPMKYSAIIIAFVLVSSIQISCKKNNAGSTSNNVTIVAKWNLINDSSSLSGSGVPQFTYGSNYIGTPADYYDFSTNGNVYIKEGASLDTMRYEVDSTIISFSPQFTSGHYTMNIASLTDTSATLLIGTNPPSSANLTPGGYEFKIINLKR